MAAVEVSLLCLFLLVSTDALYLSSTTLLQSETGNHDAGVSPLPLAIPSEDQQPSSKEDNFNDILKTNIYLAHLTHKPETTHVKIEESTEVTTSNEKSVKIVNVHNNDKASESKDDLTLTDIIIFPDSDIIIPPKTKTANKIADINDTVITNITTEAKSESKKNESAKTDKSDQDLLSRFGLTDKEYLLVPIVLIPQNVVPVATGQPVFDNAEVPNNNVLLFYPRPEINSAVNFPNQGPNSGRPNYGYQGSPHANNNNPNSHNQVSVNNNLNNNFASYPAQQSHHNSNYGANPGYVQQHANNNLEYPQNGPINNGNVNFPVNNNPSYGQENTNNNYINNAPQQPPSYNTNLNTNWNNNQNNYNPQNNFNTNSNIGVQQYPNPNQGYQPSVNQIYGTQNQNVPSNAQLLILPSGFQSVASPGYQNTSPSGSQNVGQGSQQLYVLAPGQGNFLLLAPGGSGQSYLVVPRNT